jgi:hypothetical protein
MGAVSPVLAVILLATGVSGCSLLNLLLGGPPDFDPDASAPPFPFPSTAPAFTTGSATIVTNGQTIHLDELAGDSTADAEFGTHVSWESEDGWYLTFSTYPDLGGFPSPTTISIDRIADHEHWVTLDPTRCVATADGAGATGVSGTATCRGLRWADFFSSYSGIGIPKPIPDQPAFDAEVTFEAH